MRENHGGKWAVMIIFLLLTSRIGLPARIDPQASSVVATSTPLRLEDSPRPDSGVNLWRSMGALFLALGGLLTAAYFLKRRGVAGFGALDLRRIQVVEKYPIDLKRTLVLVAVDDHELLLGVGPDRITPLHRQRRRRPAGERSEPLTKENAVP